MILIWPIIFLLFILGVIEKWRHLNRIRNIPVRIHVNGARGKSMLTRMITDLFSNDGWKVTAKVTGEQPKFYVSSTGWTQWKRFGPARIKEQMRFIKQSYIHRPEVIVLENMALEPENQYASESLIIHSDLCVITNFRPDHQEIMGESKYDVARTLSNSFPENSTILLPETQVLPSVVTTATNLHSKLIRAKIPGPVQNIFTAVPAVFKPHFSLLYEISRIYKVPIKVFEQTVESWQQSLQLHNFLLALADCSEEKSFINLFSCNDITSTNEVINNLEFENVIQPPYDVILTCRADRPLRTIFFLEWILSSLSIQHLVITGSFPMLKVKRVLNKYKKHNQAILIHRKIDPERILLQLKHNSNFILGMGNFIRTGEKFLTYLS